MDEQEKKETNQIKEKYNEAKQSVKRKKNIIKVIATIKSIIAGIISFVSAFWPIILGAIIVFGLLYLVDKIGDNGASSAASKATMKEEVKIEKEDGTDDYSFKIDKDVNKKYLEFLNQAYYEGYYHYRNPDLDKKEFIYDENDADFTNENLEEWFKTKDYKKYLVKMIRAQIASSYPRLGENEGKIDPLIDPLNPIDKNGDYVQQGIAEIQRTSINKDGTTEQARRLKYLPYDNSSGQVVGPTFKSLVEANDPEALNYFSFSLNSESEDLGSKFDDSGPATIYYATYQETVVTVNGVEDSSLHTYIIKENTKSYETITKLCEMPFNFLYALLKESENPEYISAVIDLLLEESKIVLMIQDELMVTMDTEVDTSYYAQKTVVSNYRSVETSENSEEYEWEYVSDSNPSYSYPSGNAEETTTVITNYNNTANVFLKEAHTWCIDFEQSAVEPANHEIIEGEEHTTMSENSGSDITSLSYSGSATGGPSDSPTSAGQTTTVTSTYTSTSSLLYSTMKKLDIETYTWNIVPITEKKINYEKFLGLWKNDTGEYYLGCKYDPNGKLVKFDLPKDSGKNFNVPASKMTMYNEQRIDGLINLLEDCEDTEMQEQLMKYYWNIYMDEDVYEVDLGEILSLFNTNFLNTISGGKLENYIKAWENSIIWKYEIGEYSTPPLDYMSEDGLYYIVYEDGSNGHNNISYGIATFITNPGNVKVNHPKYGGGYYNWQSEFSSRGVDVTTLDTGSLVAKDVADAVFLEILAGFENEVDTYLSNHGITLSQNQRDALVAVCYQYGNILGFADAYEKSLDEQGNIDPEAIRENFILVSNNNAKPFDYSSTSDRKYANWHLFTQETYIDRSGNEINAVGGSILECAKQIHDYMSDPAHLYYYCLGGSESSINEHRSAGITNCGLSANFQNSQIPGSYGYRLTCCATFVSWVLESAGELDAHADGVLTLSNYLKARGWSTISSYSELQPADVVIMDTDGVNNGEYAHVQLYVGNGTWYNAGGNWSIHQVEPYSDDVRDEFVFALRAPN